VTHDQVEAMTMGDRVAVLRFGTLQQFATPTDLYDRPANAFVAGFIGSPAMNLFTTHVTADGVDVAGTTLPLPRSAMSALAAEGLREVTVGIRPEELELGTGGGAGFTATVELVEELGSESYVYTRNTGAPLLGLDGDPLHLVARAPGRTPAKLAESVHLTVKPHGRIHLFHPETGLRIGD
ncbi:MAG TPA: TOBE domain-containing protein, partial [Aldersonia sp.]